MSRRRKPPRPHRVNPTDPRYSNGVRAAGYPRGSGEGARYFPNAPMPFDEHVFDDKSEEELREIYVNMYRNVYGSTEDINVGDLGNRAAVLYFIKLVYNDAVFNRKMNIDLNAYR